MAAAVLGGTLAVSFFEAGFRGAGAIGATEPGAGTAGLTKPGAAGAGTAVDAGGATGAGATGAGALGGLGRVEGGLGSPPAVGAVSPEGGLGGAIGAAPGAVGGLGGRFNITFSRGVLEPGAPSLRGGRTIRTVSFFGSDMAGWILDGEFVFERKPRLHKQRIHVPLLPGGEIISKPPLSFQQKVKKNFDFPTRHLGCT